MTPELIITPMLPKPVILIIAGFVLLPVLCAAFGIYWRRAPGQWLGIGLGGRKRPLAALLRAIAGLGLLGLLLEPAIQIRDKTALSDQALIIVDQSASQSIDGRDDVAIELTNQLKNTLAAFDDVDIIETTIDGEERTRLGTDVAAAIGATERGRLSSVFLLTDGQSVDKPDPAMLPDATAFHVFLTGRTNEIDRKITLINAPRYGIVNDSVDVSFRVDDLGPDGILENINPERNEAAGPEIVLRLNGEEIARQRAPLGREISFKAPLDRPGKSVIELTAKPRDDEISTANNTVVLPIEAIRDRLRVMLISGEPHNGERVWRGLLKSDPAIDLVHFTILRPAEKQAADGFIDQRELALIEFPQDELFIKKIDEFDLIVFDRYTYRGVLNAFHFDNIARYVENGGAVLVASGPEFSTPLSLAARYNFSYLLPAIPSGSARDGAFRPQINDIGARHPVTAGLQDTDFWGRWLRIMPALARTGRTLMEDETGEPLLVLDRVEKGRVGVLLSDQVWLWARGFDGGGPHGELLRRIAHWLMREPELEEEQLTIFEQSSDLIVERRTLDDTAPVTDLIAPDGTRTALSFDGVENGLFRSRIENPDKGLYRAESGNLFAIGAAGLAAPPEFVNLVSDQRALAPLTDVSGGGVFWPRGESVNTNAIKLPRIRRLNSNATDRSGAAWAGLPRRRAATVNAIRIAPLAPPYAYLALIGLSILLAWLIEGRRYSG
ncbi:MAG: hypothetical protein AAF720_00320 [Pseudomonadota bacterium]